MCGITLIIICLTFIILYFILDSSYWKKRNVLQVNGILWKFMSGKQSMPEIIKNIYDTHSELDHVGIFLGMTPTLVLRDLQNIKSVLHGDFQSFHARGLVTNATDILTDNLFFTDDYKRWKLQRQKMSPFLTNAQIKNMFYIMEKCAKDFVDYIESNSKNNNKDEHESYDSIYTYTTACISSTIFGIDKGSQNSVKTPLNKIIYESLKTSLKFNLKFAIASVSPKLYKLLNLKTFGLYQESFVEIVKNAIKKRRNKKKTHHDFIDTCLTFENEGILKDFVTGYQMEVNVEFLAAQAFVFLLGGIDTVATALHFTLLELSNNPKILQKAHHEVDKIFRENMNKITYDDVDKMEYMDMVINEVMRKYPPIGVTQRKCCKVTILPKGNIKIDKDTNILIPIFALHRDEKYFPNPDVFDPERFSPENVDKIIKYSFIPFGEGKRICIGTRLAFMQMKVCLAWLLRKYTLKEQSSIPKGFEPSFFAIRNTKIRYEIIPRT